MKITSETSKKELFNIMCNWERQHGEDFLDYIENISFNIIGFLYFCIGKGTMPKRVIDRFDNNQSIRTLCDLEYSYMCEEFGDQRWLFNHNTFDPKDDSWDLSQLIHFKIVELVCDYILATDTYIERINKFLEEGYDFSSEDNEDVSDLYNYISTFNIEQIDCMLGSKEYTWDYKTNRIKEWKKK